MSAAFVIATLIRRGLLNPGSPIRIAAQLHALGTWGFGLVGELRQAAARSPNRIAVIDENGRETSYAELLDRARQTAAALHHAGVRPGDRVGLLGRNHRGTVQAMVGTCLLGADPVLANTGLSAHQLAVVAADHELRALLHDDEFAPALAELPGSVLRIGETWLEAATGAGGPPPASGAPVPEPTRTPVPKPDAGREGRTIVLTSGTTGAPRGARRPTPGGLGPLASIIDRIPLRAGDRLFIAAPLFHTWGYAALQLAFALRATVVLRRRFEPVAVCDTLAGQRCVALFAVPVMIQRMLEAASPDPPEPADGVASGPAGPGVRRRLALRVVAVSGSALPGNLATRFMDRYGDVLYNLYGSTEVSWASIATPVDLRSAPGTAGRPPYGTRVAILDHHGRPVPPGQIGRIFVGNDMLFEGYTSGAGREARDGLLATGDLGHLDDNGLLFVDGREDDMIVSGGENVFPAQVEDLLVRLPQVREAAVVGVPDPEYGQRLAAFLVLDPGTSLSADQVREHVRRRLARFCVPRDVYFLPALPRNATGKVVTRDLVRRPPDNSE